MFLPHRCCCCHWRLATAVHRRCRARHCHTAATTRATRLLLANRRKIRMRHRLLRRQSLRRIVAQQTVEKVQTLGRTQMHALARDEALKRLGRVATDHRQQRLRDCQAVLVDPAMQRIGAQHASNLGQLIGIVATVEEWFTSKNLPKRKNNVSTRTATGVSVVDLPIQHTWRPDSTCRANSRNLACQ
jgi:hypothetical protein